MGASGNYYVLFLERYGSLELRYISETLGACGMGLGFIGNFGLGVYLES